MDIIFQTEKSSHQYANHHLNLGIIKPANLCSDFLILLNSNTEKGVPVYVYVIHTGITHLMKNTGIIQCVIIPIPASGSTKCLVSIFIDGIIIN